MKNTPKDYNRIRKMNTAMLLNVCIILCLIVNTCAKEGLHPITQEIVNLSASNINTVDEIENIIYATLSDGTAIEKQAVYESLKHVRIICRDARYAYGGGKTTTCNNWNYSAVFESIIKHDSCDIWKVIKICGDSLTYMVTSCLEEQEIKDTELTKWLERQIVNKDTVVVLSALHHFNRYGTNEEKIRFLEYFDKVPTLDTKLEVLDIYSGSIKNADDAKPLIKIFNVSKKPEIKIKIAESIIDIEDNDLDKVVISVLNDKEYFIRDHLEILDKIKSKPRKCFLPVIQVMKKEGRLYDRETYIELIRVLSEI